jgi:hypothetical protein
MSPATKILLPLNAEWDDLGWRIELGYRLKMSGGGMWAATVSKRRMTKSGQSEGKPDKVVTLIEDDPVKLLRQIADLFEAGEIELNGAD